MERQQPRDLRILIRLVTPFIIAALVVGAVLQYRQATDDLETRFNESQAYLARQAADRLSEVFAEVHKFLVVMGHVTDHGEDGPVFLASLMERVVGELREHGALGAWWRAPGGKLLLTSSGAIELERLTEQIRGCRGSSLCLEGPLTSSLSRAGRVLVASIKVPATGMPVESAGAPAATGLATLGPALQPPSRATIGIVIDWGELQELIGRVTKLSRDSYAWVLDAEGRLIMHPEHREQLGRDALQRDSACARCHLSFDVHRRMSRGGSGTGRIQVVGGAPKLVAFTPFAAGDQRWSLAVAAPARQVTVKERRSLLSILFLTGAIVLVMVTGAVLLDRESSRRVRAASAFSRELASKVAERTEEIEALYGRLAGLQAHHTRLERVAVAGEMAAIVAHEIRTPLNALSINAQMISRKLRRGLNEADRDKTLESLATLEREIQRINNLLEDHLLALVRHRPARAEALCLDRVVQEAISFMEPEAVRAGVELLPELGQAVPAVAADPAKLRQVLLNILLNAIQAMPDGGKVFISTYREKSLGVVSIKDTGPGIANADGQELDHVFRPFVTTKEDGTGLGLAICARLVKEMNGSIRVLSRPGDGATFLVAIPLSGDKKEVDPCR